MARRLLFILVAVAAAGLASSFLLSATSSGASSMLTANVGPDFNISLKDSDGHGVSQLDPGTYTINVTDQATEHNFRLTGPGVDQGTGIQQTGSDTWTVTFVDGTYTFKCDAHPGTMLGTFDAGNPPPPPPPPPPATPGTLKGVVGPGFTISLKTRAGKKVSKVKAGKYTLKISDRSPKHNFHLLGPALSRKTGITFKGSATWKVTFKKGKTYVFRCDSHPKTMKGSFKAV